MYFTEMSGFAVVNYTGIYLNDADLLTFHGAPSVVSSCQIWMIPLLPFSAQMGF